MSTYAFPAELPSDEFRAIAAAITSRRVNRSLLLPAWVVQGYIEGKIPGASGNLVGAAPDVVALDLGDDALAEYLELAAKPRVGGLTDAALLALPWRSMALAVAKLVVRILER